MRILFVTHAFPPLSIIASHRTYGWARAWAAAGHEVHVLTTAKHSFDGPQDLFLPTDNLHVHAVSWFSNKAVQQVPTSTTPAGQTSWNTWKQRTRQLRNRLGLLADIRLLLVPSLLRVGMKLTSDKVFDVIVGVYGPPSSIIAASLLQRKTRIPLVIDYHDLWSENYVQQRTTMGKRFAHALEKSLLKRALMLVTVSRGLAKRLEESFGARTCVAYFGYLRDDDDPPSPLDARSTVSNLVYAGRLYEKHQTAPKFFRSLGKALDRKPELRNMIRADFYGPDQGPLQSMITSNGVTAIAHLNGVVPQPRILAIERDAVGLLFFDWADPDAEGVLTGKLFEYLRSKRPVIFIGAGFTTEASELVRQSGAAVILQTEEEIERFLIDWPQSLPQVNRNEAFISGLSCTEQGRIVLAEICKGLHGRQ